MLTLKFYGADNGKNKSCVVSCERYETLGDDDSDVIGIVTYVGTKGTQWYVSLESEYYACYVENLSGKTIDKFTFHRGLMSV